jgi:hypothetical protein
MRGCAAEKRSRFIPIIDPLLGLTLNHAVHAYSTYLAHPWAIARTIVRCEAGNGIRRQRSP